MARKVTLKDLAELVQQQQEQIKALGAEVNGLKLKCATLADNYVHLKAKSKGYDTE